ncbi:MAG: phosphatidate cytidylyltransferase [Planctomycetes bacterium]|nr:phosphatidate cytidylyltransferase [Planctomycetota bacterium]
MNWSTLPSTVRWTIAGIFALLVVASLVVRTIRRAKPDANLGELAARVRSWWVMVIVFVIAMVLSRTVSLVFFAFVSFLALKEYFSNTPVRLEDRRPLFWAYLAIPLQYYWIGIEWYGLFIIFIPVYCFLAIPIRMLVIGQTDGYLRAAATIHWGLMICVFCLSHAAFLLILRPADDVTMLAGPGLVLFLVVLTQLNDVAQYIWGKSLGKHRIVPRVSPGKTWEGFLGGAVTTTALACFLGPTLTPMTIAQSAIAGALIAVVGFFGDINLSALKRDVGIKDSGSLLPGHGGILDRVDSLTYTAPIFFHYVYYLFRWQTFGTTGG